MPFAPRLSNGFRTDHVAIAMCARLAWLVFASSATIAVAASAKPSATLSLSRRFRSFFYLLTLVESVIV